MRLQPLVPTHLTIVGIATAPAVRTVVPLVVCPITWGVSRMRDLNGVSSLHREDLGIGCVSHMITAALSSGSISYLLEPALIGSREDCLMLL